MYHRIESTVVATLRLTNQKRKHRILRTMIGPSQSRNNTTISLQIQHYIVHYWLRSDIHCNTQVFNIHSARNVCYKF